MKSVVKRIIAIVCIFALTVSAFLQAGSIVNASEIIAATGSPASTMNLIVTEACIDDISRPEWIPTGAAAFDPMEYVEIYNPTGSEVNFSQDYSLYHFRTSANKEYSLPLYGQTDDVVIPAHSSIVLWGFLASRYATASAAQTPTISNFRDAFDIDDSVGIYKVNTTSCIGFYNTYNGSFRIKDISGNLISEAAYTPATDSADGKSIEFRMPAEGTTMLVYKQKTAPTPGVVSQEQYTPPIIPKQPVIGNIVAKDTYTNEEPLTVSADITDAQSASIYVKQSTETAYLQIPMGNNGDGTFSVSVPRTKLWGESLTWYIEAYNDTKTTKSEDNNSTVQYSYDVAKQPQVLMTELKTEDTGYNYLEFYNNSDTTINFAHYNAFYEYPSGLSYVRWTFATKGLYLESGQTVVVWLDDKGKTVAQFNQHYGVQLEENKSIIKVNYSGMSPDIERTIKLGNTYEKPIIVATYHEDEIDDTALTASIHYTFSRDNGTRMVKADITSVPTPGTVKAWQVPSERVLFDNYGGSTDDESTMVLKPRDEIPETIEEGEALNVAFDCYDTATGVNTVETYYKFDDDGQYSVKMEKAQRIAKQLVTSIPASEFLGHEKVTFYIRAYNAYRYYDTQAYEVLINPSINTEGITLNIKDNQIVNGTTTIAAIAVSTDKDISIKIDGEEQFLIPMLENGAYFSYKADKLTSYYKNAITVGNNVIKFLSSWANVNQKAAHIESQSFVQNANGDYEVTVTLRAGTQGSPFEETEGADYASFTMSNMALYLTNGTFVYPDNGIVYANQYTIGDSTSKLALDVHFTIAQDQLKAKGIFLDTTVLSEGEHVVKASVDNSSKNVVVIVDNMAPEVNFGIENGQTLYSGDVISSQVKDEASGIDDTKTEITLDDKKIQLPYTVNSNNLKNGTHNLHASYTDYAGHTTQKAVTFTSDITVPTAGINQAKQTKSTAATMSVQVNGENAEPVTAEFLEGKKLSLEQNNIQVSSGAGDVPIMDGGSDSLSSSSNKELPYQLFQVQTGDLADEDLIEAQWKGIGYADGTLQMFVLNVAENKWESIAAADEGQIKVAIKAKDHVNDGKAMLLVQNRSEGSYPSTTGSAVTMNTETADNGGSSIWDGTGVPENYDFSFAWISDPQYYVEAYSELDHYNKMNQWIVDNRDTYNIKYTINTGDLIDEWDRDEEWQLSDKAQKILDDANMPNGVLAGNHDVASSNEEYENYWKYFCEQRYKDNSYYGGSYRNNLGHYDLISAGKQDFIILYMGWDVYQREVDWMNEVLAQYPNRKAIIALHRYLKQGGTLDYTGYLVQKEVVAKNKNVFAVINGHYFGAAIKIDGFDDDKDEDGIKERKVYQICSDYQGAAEGGLEYVKMAYFDLENSKIYMNAYSPYLNDFNYFDNAKLASYDIGVTASSQDIYELDVEFDTNLKTLVTMELNVDVYTNRTIGKQENVSGEVTQLWEGLTPNTQYWWYANLTNEKGDTCRTSLNSVRTLGIGAPEILSAEAGDGHVKISWSPVEGSTGYNIYSSTTSGAICIPGGGLTTSSGISISDGGSTTSSAITVVTVAGSVYDYDMINLTNGICYYFVVTATSPAGESAGSNVVSATPQSASSVLTVPGAPTDVTAIAGIGKATVNFISPLDNGGSSITEYIVTSSPGGITTTGTGNTITVTGLSNGTTYKFTVKAVNSVGSSQESTASNEVTPYSSSDGGGSTYIEPVKSGEIGVEIIINGKTEAVATAVTTKVNDKTVTTITLNHDKVDEMIRKEGNNVLVTIPFNTDSDVAVLQLNGQTINSMEDMEAVLQIKTGNVIYTIPAAQINIDNILLQMGTKVDLKDIVVNIRISAASQQAASIIEDVANKNNYQVMIKPIEFEITCTRGNKTVEVSNFNGYVERMLAIPEGINMSKITTGVVLNSDGTFSHVPTVVIQIDGKYYAKINSLTNSTYLAIASPKTFEDVESHWAKEAVNDMGSRLIIGGVGNSKFEPDRNITRAEFVTVVVKALGLMRSTTGTDAFKDVTKDAWYYDAVSIANEYGIISGYGNGKFGPTDQITREQAMAVITKAMKITGLKVEFKEGEAENLLAAFGDSGQSATWVKESIAVCVKAGIVSGKSGKKLAPKDEITRAEAAVIVQRLLQKSDLI